MRCSSRTMTHFHTFGRCITPIVRHLSTASLAAFHCSMSNASIEYSVCTINFKNSKNFLIFSNFLYIFITFHSKLESTWFLHQSIRVNNPLLQRCFSCSLFPTIEEIFSFKIDLHSRSKLLFLNKHQNSF